MSRFIYKARRSPEEIIEGSIEDDSESVVANKLIQSGYYPVWIKEESADARKTAALRTKAIDLIVFTRQLSELLGSGLTLYKALDVIKNQTESGSLKTIIEGLKSRIKKGRFFSEALKKYPSIFSELYVNLARSGEESGSLNDALASMADLLEKERDIRAKIIAALTYPGLMAVVGFATIFILVTFMVPRLANIFLEMDEQLPLPTRMLIGACNFTKACWFLLVIFIAGALFLFKTYKYNPATKNKIDKLKLKIPVFGNLVMDAEIARFSRTLSMLLKNGVPILDSLSLSSQVITNDSIKKEIYDVCDNVKEGLSLAVAIKKVKSFPLFVANMTAVGEEGGFLDMALLNIARNYETEIERLIKIITALLEPCFILIMGLVVGFIVVAMILPVFEISLTVH